MPGEYYLVFRADSGQFLQVIPIHSCAPFHSIPADHSDANLHPGQATERLRPETFMEMYFLYTAQDSV